MKLHVPLGQVLLSSSDTSAEQRFRLHSRTSGGQSLEWVVVKRSSEDWCRPAKSPGISGSLQKWGVISRSPGIVKKTPGIEGI